MIFSIVAVLAMVVDHSRQSLSLETLQRAADAAALAGAKRFNGKLNGWREAKQAAVLALKQNPIHGVTPELLATLQLLEGPSAFNAPTSVHEGSRGKIGKLNVTIERGVLWHDFALRSPISEAFPEGRQGGFRFVSLETHGDAAVPIPQGVEGYLYSNAVRVTLSLDSLSTSFGRVMGVLGFSNLARSAIAVTHEELEVSIAPIAIPLCALRLNDDPYAQPDQQQLSEINFSATCARQGIGSEADPKRELQSFLGSRLESIQNDEIARRREGIARFESYLRPLYAYYDPAKGISVCFTGNKAGYRHNCKTIPLWGVLGVPSSSPGRRATASEVAEAFVNGIRTSPGQFWASLESLQGFKLSPSLTDAIAQSIVNPAFEDRNTYRSTFYDEFTEGLEGNDSVRLARRNFPFIRTQRPSCGSPGPLDDMFDPERRPCIEDDPATPINDADPYHDLRVFWPTTYEVDGEPVVGRLLMDRRRDTISRQPLDYTNPLCHHPSIPIDSVNSSGDPRRHVVRRTLAAVIAPGAKERPDGSPVTYCNFEELFGGYEDNRTKSVAPVPESKPVIVGFIPITAYDVGLTDLDAIATFQPVGATNPFDYRRINQGQVTAGTVPPNGWERVATPRWQDPVSGEIIVDRNTGELDVEGNYFINRAKGYIKQYDEDHEEWEECVEKSKSKCEDQRAEAQGGDFLGIPEEYLACFDFTNVFKNPEFGNVVSAIGAIQPDTCSSINPVTLIETSYPCIKEAKDKANGLFNVLQNHFEENIPALDYAHCVPRKDLASNPPVHDKNDPDYYVQPLDTTRAGFGCGGVLFRAACGANDGVEQNSLYLAGGIPWDRTSPALVAEDTP